MFTEFYTKKYKYITPGYETGHSFELVVLDVVV